MEIGKTFKNSKGLEFIVESKDELKSDSKHTYYNIRFLLSGYTDSVRSDSIKNRLVSDKLYDSCCGVASIGYINSREHWKEYTIWEDMIYRCYCINDKSYKYYGGCGVTVCDRWHRFDLFFEDIKYIEGYDENMFFNGKLRLDKDIKSKGQKIYSLKTTKWITDLQNQKQRAKEYNMKHKKYAVFPDGHTELILNVTDFCKEHNLHRQNVNLCLCGKQSQTKGYKFYKE